MKVLINFFFVASSFYLSTTVLLGQVIRCTVVDQLTQKAVPYVSVVSAKTGTGIHSDEEGYFEWGSTLRDRLIISCVGYKHLKVAVAALKQEHINQLVLQLDIVVLKEILIKPGTRKVTK